MQGYYMAGVIYLITGFIYAFSILVTGRSSWKAFPINMLGGPIVLVYNFFKYLVFKTLR